MMHAHRIKLALLATLFVACQRKTESIDIQNRLGSGDTTWVPPPRAAILGTDAIVMWCARGLSRVRLTAGDGVVVLENVTGLPCAREIVRKESVLFFGGAIAAIDTGTLEIGARIALPDPPPAPYQSIAFAPTTFAVADTHEGKVEIRIYDRATTALRGRAAVSAIASVPMEVAVSWLAADKYLLAWTANDDMLAVEVDATGRILREPKSVHRVKLGGALHGAVAAPTRQGGALVVWQDSSPGPWQAMAIEFDPSGAAGPARQVSRTGGDNTHPHVLFDGERNWVTWKSGIRWGVLAASGKGSVSMRAYGENTPTSTYRFPGSVESYSVDCLHGRCVVAGGVREGPGFAVHGKIVTPRLYDP